MTETMLVPIEPTYDMIRAARRELVDVAYEDESGEGMLMGCTLTDDCDVRAIWKAMLAAVKHDARKAAEEGGK